MAIDIVLTPQILDDHGIGLHLAKISNINQLDVKHRLGDFRSIARDSIKERQEIIRQNIARIGVLFAEWGHINPLEKQFERCLSSGLPEISPLVDVLLISEMVSGCLMGLQDSSNIRGTVRFDLSKLHESYQGMRGLVECSDGEPVLRDDEGIFASLFRGPDSRTKLSTKTRDILFFVFAVKGIEASTITSAFNSVIDLLHTVDATVDVCVPL